MKAAAAVAPVLGGEKASRVASFQKSIQVQNQTHKVGIRQLRFQVKVLEAFQVGAFSLGRGWGDLFGCAEADPLGSHLGCHRFLRVLLRG